MRGQTRQALVAYGAAQVPVDLGDEPPLTLGEKTDDPGTPQPRAVSWRWLTGTVLTGVTSIVLMGAALMAALSPNQFAARPEVVATNAPDASGAVFGRKADRMHPAEQRVSTRQVIQVSTITRQDGRDFIKPKPFVKISATLGTSDPEIAAEVPPYNPVQIFANAAAADDSDQPTDVSTVASGDDHLYGAAIDGEVAVKVTAFPIAAPDLEAGVALDPSEVEQIVRVSANAGSGSSDADVTALAYDDPSADVAASAPFSALGVKIVPENVSNIAKSDASASLDEGYQERIVPVTGSQSLRDVLDANDITGDDADEIIAALSQLIDVSRLRAGQRIRIAYAIDPNAPPSVSDLDADPNADPAAAAAVQQALRPIRVSIYEDGVHQATVARGDNNVFVRADEPSFTPDLLADVPVTPPVQSGPPRLYNAIYETALEQKLPQPLIDELIRIFAYDVDLQGRVGAGDTLDILHSMPDPTNPDAAEPEILYASLTLGGVPKRYYRFRTPDDNVVDYYDEDGKSAKKFLIRKPVTVGRISSGFGWRVHPILGYRRLHAGVDYAAPKGTPIYAAGNGIIEKAGRSSGYGNLIIIRHSNGYETAYGHQSAFAKGIAPGVRVRQGQLIGYVGSTGLSTGAHVHFEIRINGQPVDPLRVRLPQGRVLESDTLASFEDERQRIDALFGNQVPPQKVAQADALTD